MIALVQPVMPLTKLAVLSVSYLWGEKNVIYASCYQKRWLLKHLKTLKYFSSLRFTVFCFAVLTYANIPLGFILTHFSVHLTE